jgi:hypothetical protein
VDLGEEYIQEMTASVPLGRLGTVDEIGYAALFLATARPVTSPGRRSWWTAARCCPSRWVRWTPADD